MRREHVERDETHSRIFDFFAKQLLSKGDFEENVHCTCEHAQIFLERFFLFRICRVSMIVVDFHV